MRTLVVSRFFAQQLGGVSDACFEFGFTVRFWHSLDDSVSLLIMNNFLVFVQQILILLQFVMQWSQTCFAHSIVVRQGNAILLSRQSDFVVTTFVANWLSGVLSSTIPMLSVSQKVFNMFLILTVSFVSFKNTSLDMIRFETTVSSYGELLVGPEKKPTKLVVNCGGTVFFSYRFASDNVPVMIRTNEDISCILANFWMICQI